MNVTLSKRAERDLVGIGMWIARDDPDIALSYVRQLRQTCTKLPLFPRAFPSINHRSGRDIRRKVHDQYLVVYEVRAQDIIVLAIVHGARDLTDILPTL